MCSAPAAYHLRRQIGIARSLGGAAGPISRPGLAVGSGRAGDDPGEMVERERRLVAVAQRDIAGEELRPRNMRCRRRADPAAARLIGGLGIAGREQPAGDDAAARSHHAAGCADRALGMRRAAIAPRRRILSFLRRQRACVEGEPGIGAQRCRDLGDTASRRWRHRRRAPDGPRQAAGNRPGPAAACAAPHRSGRPRSAGRAGPGGLRAQPAAVAGQEAALVEGAEIALDPRRAQRRGAGLGLAAVDRQLARRATLPTPLIGGWRLSQSAATIVVFGAGARQFGPPPQLLLRRPIRVLIDKRGDIGETGLSAVPRV